MVAPESNWSDNPDSLDDDVEYHKFDKTVGKLAHECLDMLSQDCELDEHGWTKADDRALGRLAEIDWLGRLLVPPATTDLNNRISYLDAMATLRTALPFSEAERLWLFFDSKGDISGMPGGEKTREVIRSSDTTLISAGIARVVYGRDLLHRWWSWRREIGEYANQGSLDQARDALKDLTELLTPEHGLPQTYTALRATERASDV